jgi:5-methylcytosine-specific restriction endonuclease McrA
MGVRPHYDRHGAAIYRSRRWKSVRFLAKRRDGFKCVECGAAGRLEVDHVKPIRSHPELAYDLTNLQCLCPSCHARKTRLEVGNAPLDPERQAWRDLVLNAPQPQASTEKPHA